MTWPRYNELHENWRFNPPPDVLLTYVAAAHGYKIPPRPLGGQKAAEELKRLFPTGTIKL